MDRHLKITTLENRKNPFSLLGLDWKKYVKYDKHYERAAEVDLLVGDATKAKRILGWEPKVRFKELVELMVEHDLELARMEGRTFRAVKILEK